MRRGRQLGHQQPQQLTPQQYYQWAAQQQQQYQQPQQRQLQQQHRQQQQQQYQQQQQPQQQCLAPHPRGLSPQPMPLHPQQAQQYGVQLQQQQQQQPPPHLYRHHQQQQQQQQQQQRGVAKPAKATWQRAPKFHQIFDATEEHQQGRPGDDIIPILLEETIVTCPVQGCWRRLVSDFTQASFGFVLDQDVDRVLNSGKAERKRLLVKFHRMVNTLLNQGGGLVFIHTSPHLLNFWDEQVDDDLMELVADDTLFDENFERHIVEGHVIFRVKPRRNRPISTLDFQSKISLNKGLVDPTHGQMRRLLTRPAPDRPPAADPQGGTLDSVSLEDGQRIPFHENLNVQAKVVLPKDLDKKTPKTCGDTGSKLVHFWWHSLKLPQYVAAFAKQQSGGSFFLGLMEEKEVSGTKWKALHNSSGLPEVLQSDMRFWADDKNTEEKKIFHLAKESDVPKFEHKSGYFTCQGIPLTRNDRDVVERQLKRNVQELLLLQPGLNNQQVQNRLVELYFYPVRESQGDDRDMEELAGEGARGGFGGKSHAADNSQSSTGLYVLEARVNYYHGVCFQNKQGPEAYKFDHDRRPTCALRVPIRDWVKVQA